jgi:MFS family permease
MLVLSMLLMGFGTLLVGVLPTYEQIGVLAPVLLILLRILQAVGLGGETSPLRLTDAAYSAVSFSWIIPLAVWS